MTREQVEKNLRDAATKFEEAGELLAQVAHDESQSILVTSECRLFTRAARAMELRTLRFLADLA